MFSIKIEKFRVKNEMAELMPGDRATGHLSGFRRLAAKNRPSRRIILNNSKSHQIKAADEKIFLQTSARGTQLKF